MDQFDRAQALEAAEREAVIAAHRQVQKRVSLSHCEDCGVEIPAERQAIGGITRCVHCQSEMESKQKRGLR